MPGGKASKQNRRETMASANNLEKLPQLPQVAFRGEIYQGPLPDPEMLERYKKRRSLVPRANSENGRKQ